MGESLAVVGLNQHATSIDVFERATLSEDALAKALETLLEHPEVREAVVLSTCMRTEVYALVDRFHEGVSHIYDFFTYLLGSSFTEVSDLLYCKYEEAVAAHLFEVAAGLDSPVLGEGEVLGQVRRAWEVAHARGASGQALSSLFRQAVVVGKRVRSETAIARGITSLSHAAVALCSDKAAGGLAGKRVLLLGAGAMGKGMASALRSEMLSARSPASTRALDAAGIAHPAEEGLCADVVVVSRTTDRAAELAAQTGARWNSLAKLDDELEKADIVLVSVATPSFVLHEGTVRKVMSARSHQPLLIVDLGVPRNVESRVAQIDGVTLIDLDRLRSFVNAQMAGREAEIDRARAMVGEEVVRHRLARRERDVAPLVAALYKKAEEIRRSEMDRHRQRIDGLGEREREVLESLTQAIVSKLLHTPAVRLKEAGRSGSADRLAEALRDLFDL